MSQSLVAAWNKDAKEGERRAHRLEELSRLAFAEMRALLAELRPLDEAVHGPPAEPGSLADIASYGLKRALQRLLAVLAPETLDVQVDFTNYRYQALEHEEALCRICQEAISNALRHSNAQHLTVCAEVLDTDRVRVEIADDGQGFDAAALEPCSVKGRVSPATGDVSSSGTFPARIGLGMQTMRERAAALGGTTTIHSERGKGTRVVVELPRRDR
jgi:signal transduction histidine kinase